MSSLNIFQQVFAEVSPELNELVKANENYHENSANLKNHLKNNQKLNNFKFSSKSKKTSKPEIEKSYKTALYNKSFQGTSSHAKNHGHLSPSKPRRTSIVRQALKQSSPSKAKPYHVQKVHIELKPNENKKEIPKEVSAEEQEAAILLSEMKKKLQQMKEQIDETKCSIQAQKKINEQLSFQNSELEKTIQQMNEKADKAYNAYEESLNKFKEIKKEKIANYEFRYDELKATLESLKNQNSEFTAQ